MSEVEASRKRPKTGGRSKGTPNKLTGDLKAMILGALDEAGGQSYLLSQAHENPKAFLSLLARVLPMQVAGTGENGEHKIEITWRGE